MDHYNQGDRLGAEHGELYCRKENICSSLQKNPFTGRTCTRIELSRNATSAISKVLDISDPEMAAIIKQHEIHTQCDDRLVGDAITIYVDQLRPIRFNANEGATHRHGARFASTVKPTFSEIKYSQEHIRNAAIKRIQSQNNLEQK